MVWGAAASNFNSSVRSGFVLGIQGFGSRAFGFRILGLGLRFGIWGLGLWVYRVWGLGFRDWGSGFRDVVSPVACVEPWICGSLEGAPKTTPVKCSHYVPILFPLLHTRCCNFHFLFHFFIPYTKPKQQTPTPTPIVPLK